MFPSLTQGVKLRRKTENARCSSEHRVESLYVGALPQSPIGDFIPKPLSGDAPAGVLLSTAKTIRYLPKERPTPILFSSKIFEDGVRGKPLFLKRGFPGRFFFRSPSSSPEKSNFFWKSKRCLTKFKTDYIACKRKMWYNAEKFKGNKGKRSNVIWQYKTVPKRNPRTMNFEHLHPKDNCF